jgi:hypothetical protein
MNGFSYWLEMTLMLSFSTSEHAHTEEIGISQRTFNQDLKAIAYFMIIPQLACSELCSSQLGSAQE